MRVGTYKETLESYVWEFFWLVYTGTFAFASIVEGYTLGIVFHSILFGFFLNCVVFKHMVRSYEKRDKMMEDCLRKMFKVNDELLAMQIKGLSEREELRYKNG